MAKPTVKLFPKAEKDLYDLWYYIAVIKGSPINAEKFIQKLSAQFDALAASPSIGVSKDEYLKGAMQFPYQNFLIFYIVEEGGIAIVRVLYGRRNMPSFF